MGQVEAPGEPICGGAPEGLDALGDRIAAKIGNVLGENRAHEFGHGVLGLA
jgi:hypothetical protein